MIRGHGDDCFFLFTQNDHAILAARIAARWGNADFAPPAPPDSRDPRDPRNPRNVRDATLAAIELHDAGWPLHDDSPTLNDQNLPLDVFEVPASIAVRVWSASAERAEAAGDYAALLVSLHVLSLSAIPPTRERTRHDIFDINKFQHREIERQVKLRRRLGLRTDIPVKCGLAAPGVNPDEDQLRFDFALLQAADRLSLALCAGPKRALFPSIDRLPTRPGAPSTVLNVRHEPGVCTVFPWPFDHSPLAFDIPCRRLLADPFENDDAFRRAYAAAMPEIQTFTLRPA